MSYVLKCRLCGSTFRLPVQAVVRGAVEVALYNVVTAHGAVHRRDHQVHTSFTLDLEEDDGPTV